MLQNKAVLVCMLLINLVFSQVKKVDTVYIYEERIIHDTVYVEKPLSKLNLQNVIFNKSESGKKDKLVLTQNGKKVEILIDSTNVVYSKTKKAKSWFFGGKFNLGLANNSLFKELNAPNTLGFGLGIWTKKRLFNSNFSVGIGLDGFYWSSSFSFDAKENNSALNGFYFTENQQPLLFKGIENNYFQFQIPIQFYCKIKKFVLSIGLFANVSNYKSQFLRSSRRQPISLDETKTFTAQAIQIGYLLGLNYEISNKISVGLNYSIGKAKNLVFINKNDQNEQFKTQNSFSENRFMLEMIYSL